MLWWWYGLADKYSQDGSLDEFNFMREGRRTRLQAITKNPTENITTRWTFFRHARFKRQRIGIGMKRITKSWKMLMTAATYAIVKELRHFTGATLYIQFVQLAWNGSYSGLVLTESILSMRTDTLYARCHCYREVWRDDKTIHDPDCNAKVSTGKDPLEEQQQW